MRKLKVSLICVMAALLCCAFAAIVGIYANNEVAATEQITAPEKEVA